MTFTQIRKHFGSVAAARRKLGLGSRQTLYNWRDAGVPIAQQLRIERRTAGQLRAAITRAAKA